MNTRAKAREHEDAREACGKHPVCALTGAGKEAGGVVRRQVILVSILHMGYANTYLITYLMLQKTSVHLIVVRQ